MSRKPGNSVSDFFYPLLNDIARFNHLSTVFASLMMLAFLIDQVEQRCCGLFRRAREKAGRPLYLWEELRSLVFEFEIPDWETLYRAIAFGRKASQIELIEPS